MTDNGRLSKVTEAHLPAADSSGLSVVQYGTSVHYVGGSATVRERLFKYFSNVKESRNLLQASQTLNNSSPAKSFPDVLVIDVPFTVAEFNHIFRNVRRKLPAMQIICNKICFSPADLKLAKHSKLFHDVFDFTDPRIAIERRIQFWRRTRNSQELVASATSYVPVMCRSSFGLCFKRLLDVIVAATLIILLAPVFLVIALLILIESGAPIFYSAPRVGSRYRVFSFYKFRTMVPDADKMMDQIKHLNQYNTTGNGPSFIKIENDPRITRLGRFLRNSSLDELPQLFNVLKGDMSLVGNRPLPLYEAETLTTNEYIERFCAPAGITGLWQIKKRGQSEMSVEERISLDIAYARQVSPMMDFRILAATPKAMFQKSSV